MSTCAMILMAGGSTRKPPVILCDFQGPVNDGRPAAARSTLDSHARSVGGSPPIPHPHGGATDAPDRSDPDPLPAARDVRVGGPRPGGPARRDPRDRRARDARLALARPG